MYTKFCVFEKIILGVQSLHSSIPIPRKNSVAESQPGP